MPVLGTKLHLPTSRRPLVPRGRITDRLSVEAGSMPRLVLVSAPAGFGKTTVMAQWLSSDGAGTTDERRRVAWLSLDEGDSDLRRFLTHLVAALQTASPVLGAEALALMDDRPNPADRGGAGQHRQRPRHRRRSTRGGARRLPRHRRACRP